MSYYLLYGEIAGGIHILPEPISSKVARNLFKDGLPEDMCLYKLHMSEQEFNAYAHFNWGAPKNYLNLVCYSIEPSDLEDFFESDVKHSSNKFRHSIFKAAQALPTPKSADSSHEITP